MTNAIADSNFIIALVDKRDKWRQQALTLQNALKEENAELVYLDCIINETISVLGRRLEEKGRSNEFETVLERIEEIVPPEDITWIYPEVRKLYREILNLVKAYNGSLNFHDALIIVAAKQMKTPLIISFDKDFDQVEGIKRIKHPSDLKRT
jgi:predicted nucleic acid-binding protein